MARDTSNNTTNSSTVYFKVAALPTDKTPPTVRLTSPVLNQSVLTGTSLNLAATASDNVGVAGVRFVVDGMNYGVEDTTAPYSISWSSVGAFIGTHSVRAVARDAAGNTTNSTIVYFRVAALPTDNTPPTVRLTSPVLNQTVVTGTSLSLAATASDNVGVASVSFMIDGTTYGAQDTVAPYALDWSTAGVALGTHSALAVARDAAGNTTNSTSVSFRIVSAVNPDTTAPIVSITSPVAGSQLSGSVNLAASATDPVVNGATTSGVKLVEFLIDGKSVGSTAVAPYSLGYNTNSLSNGSHTVAARGTDNSGNTGNSPAISVSVSNIIDTNNLVPNPSLEIANSTDVNRPANWTFEAWSTSGITATSTYPVAGYAGAKAARTQITAYKTDGDAKWYFDPQPVKAGVKYQVSDHYKANIESRVVAWFPTNGTFNEQYIDLSPAAASSTNWALYSDFITVPSGAATMTIFHLIDGVGWLETDDYSVTLAPVSTNLINNGDLETVSQANPLLPSHWYQSGWSTTGNALVYSYGTGIGRSSSRGVKIQINTYTDGDARWNTDSIAVVPGEYYKFFDWYESNVDTRVVAHFTTGNTTTPDIYLDLRAASSSPSTWTAFSDIVQVPANAKTMEVYHLIERAGWLATDDYALQKAVPSGFDHGVVSLTFDDGWEDNVGTVLPTLMSDGLNATYYFATQYIQGNSSAGIAFSQAGVNAVKAVAAAGFEVGSHSVTHPYLTGLSTAALNKELTDSKTYLESLLPAGTVVKTFATPYGAYDDTVVNAIKNVYQSHRTVDAGYNMTDGFDPLRIKVQNMLAGTTLAEYQSWIDEAKKNNLWLVIVYHRVADPATTVNGALGDYDTPLANFGPQMQIIKNSGIKVETISVALADIGS